MLSLQDLTLTFGQKILCEHLSVDIERGTITLITGENGSGKTTLMKSLLGLHKPQNGKILLDGFDLYDLKKKDKKLFLSSCSYVGEEITLHPFDTTAKVLQGGKLSFEEKEALLQKFSLHLPPHTLISNLSFSEKRKLELIRSLLYNPLLLFWDEPLKSLDASMQSLMRDLLSNLKKSGVTIVIATVSPEQFSFLNPEKIIELHILKNEK